MRSARLYWFFLAGIVISGMFCCGCTDLPRNGSFTHEAWNTTQVPYPVVHPTFSIPNQVPFTEIPGVRIEPLPGMVVNISHENASLVIEPYEETTVIPPPPSEKPLFTVFGVGDSANDGNTRITLNSVRYNKSFDLTPYHQFGQFESYRDGYQLMVLDVTIHDLGQNHKGSSSLFNGIIVKNSNNQRISPGLSIISEVQEGPGDMEGFLFYEVPVNTAGIIMEYHFPDSVGVIAKYDPHLQASR